MLPAHCLAAGKKLKNYRFKIQSENGTFSDITVNRETFLVHPNFRINSYDKRRFLINDVAIVSIKTDQEQESAKFDMVTQSDVTNYVNLMVTDSFRCDKRGLSEFQQCFKSKIKREESKSQNKFKGNSQSFFFINLKYFKEKYLRIFNLIQERGIIHPHVFTKVEILFLTKGATLLQ